MSTITAVVEPEADGSIRLLLPEELRRSGPVRVTASFEAAAPGKKTRVPRTATPEMIKRREEAFALARKLDPFRHIADPVAWQREIREDRPLPGRE